MKKIFLVCLVLVMLATTGCSRAEDLDSKELDPNSYVEIMKVADGFCATNVSDHPVSLSVTLHCYADSTDYPYNFYPTQDYTLTPGETTTLIYKKDRTCPTIGIEEYDVKVLPKTYSLDGYVLPIFIPILIVLLLLVMFSEPEVCRIVPFAAAFLTFVILVIIRIVMGMNVSGPVIFEIWGCPFF